MATCYGLANGVEWDQREKGAKILVSQKLIVRKKRRHCIHFDDYRQQNPGFRLRFRFGRFDLFATLISLYDGSIVILGSGFKSITF